MPSCIKLDTINATEDLDFVLENGALFENEMRRLIFSRKYKSGSYEVPSTVSSIDTMTYDNFTNLKSINITENIKIQSKFIYLMSHFVLNKRCLENQILHFSRRCAVQ